MKKASNAFSAGYHGLPAHVREVRHPPLPEELRTVAKAFASLQVARHGADYNSQTHLMRNDAVAEPRFAKDAFGAWQRVRNGAGREVYLASLLLWSRWNR